MGRGDDDIGGGVMGRDNVGGKPRKGVGHVFGVGAPGPHPVHEGG
jgi:hypothetical protein